MACYSAGRSIVWTAAKLGLKPEIVTRYFRRFMKLRLPRREREHRDVLAPVYCGPAIIGKSIEPGEAAQIKAAWPTEFR